ncbi:MAG: pyridoxamine 5'-phosphate oxidase family protein [Anaeromyxobacter sp.]
MAEDRSWAALLSGFSTALLVTRGAEGHLHARPMAMRQQVRGEEIWFATSARSKKCKDLEGEPQCALTFTAADGTTLSISGRGEIFRDRKLALELWDRSWSRWFPEGPAQRDLALVRVVPEHVESHDGVTGRSEVLYTSRRPAAAPKKRRARATAARR